MGSAQQLGATSAAQRAAVFDTIVAALVAALVADVRDECADTAAPTVGSPPGLDHPDLQVVISNSLRC